MEANEIRSKAMINVTDEGCVLIFQAFMVQEVAAQLAELNFTLAEFVRKMDK